MMRVWACEAIILGFRSDSLYPLRVVRPAPFPFTDNLLHFFLVSAIFFLVVLYNTFFYKLFFLSTNS